MELISNKFYLQKYIFYSILNNRTGHEWYFPKISIYPCSFFLALLITVQKKAIVLKKQWLFFIIIIIYYFFSSVARGPLEERELIASGAASGVSFASSTV